MERPFYVRDYYLEVVDETGVRTTVSLNSSKYEDITDFMAHFIQVMETYPNAVAVMKYHQTGIKL